LKPGPQSPPCLPAPPKQRCLICGLPCDDPGYHCMCSMQVVDITPIKHRLTSITSIRVVR
jgi:hypothetical protein